MRSAEFFELGERQKLWTILHVLLTFPFFFFFECMPSKFLPKLDFWWMITGAVLEMCLLYSNWLLKAQVFEFKNWMPKFINLNILAQYVTESHKFCKITFQCFIWYVFSNLFLMVENIFNSMDNSNKVSF